MGVDISIKPLFDVGQKIDEIKNADDALTKEKIQVLHQQGSVFVYALWDTYYTGSKEESHELIKTLENLL